MRKELCCVRTFYLEMTQKPENFAFETKTEYSILQSEKPNLEFYRFLYNFVGKDWNWSRRLLMTDEELLKIIHHSDTEMYILYSDGCPVGFAELDCRNNEEIEFVYFGLTKNSIGKGLGKYLMNFIIDKVFSRSPKRFWLHTCELDHPKAVDFYQKAGFSLYKTQNEMEEIVFQ